MAKEVFIGGNMAGLFGVGSDLAGSRMSRVCSKAIAHFGEASQKQKAIEELGELIVALCRQGYGGTVVDVVDEIADVVIMANQLRQIFGTIAVDRRIEQKLDRLEMRISPTGLGY